MAIFWLTQYFFLIAHVMLHARAEQVVKYEAKIQKTSVLGTTPFKY